MCLVPGALRCGWSGSLQALGWLAFELHRIARGGKRQKKKTEQHPRTPSGLSIVPCCRAWRRWAHRFVGCSPPKARGPREAAQSLTRGRGSDGCLSYRCLLALPRVLCSRMPAARRDRPLPALPLWRRSARCMTSSGHRGHPTAQGADPTAQGAVGWPRWPLDVMQRADRCHR